MRQTDVLAILFSPKTLFDTLSLSSEDFLFELSWCPELVPTSILTCCVEIASTHSVPLIRLCFMRAGPASVPFPVVSLTGLQST